MKRYDEYSSVEELCEAYGIKSLSQFITEKDDVDNKADEKEAEEKAKKKYNKNKKKDTAVPDKVVKPEEYEVNYAEFPDKYNNIFKHIIVFTNDRDTKNNKTLKNIEDAVKRLKKDGAEVVPELHVFVAAKVDADDDVHEITLSDDKETFKISKESNLDTLVFARLGHKFLLTAHNIFRSARAAKCLAKTAKPMPKRQRRSPCLPTVTAVPMRSTNMRSMNARDLRA